MIVHSVARAATSPSYSGRGPSPESRHGSGPPSQALGHVLVVSLSEASDSKTLERGPSQVVQ